MKVRQKSVSRASVSVRGFIVEEMESKNECQQKKQ
jgi:hypothetical protein